jgi:hypothetical protein
MVDVHFEIQKLHILKLILLCYFYPLPVPVLMTSHMKKQFLFCFRSLLPRPRDTSISHLIINCGLFLILSSALPLLVKVLGQFSKFTTVKNYRILCCKLFGYIGPLYRYRYLPRKFCIGHKAKKKPYLIGNIRNGLIPVYVRIFV